MLSRCMECSIIIQAMVSKSYLHGLDTEISSVISENGYSGGTKFIIFFFMFRIVLEII